MKRLAAILWMSVAAMACAAEPAGLAAANEQFAAGKYMEAATAYEALLNDGPPSAELYFNLGNALERADQPVKAALNYERALVLDPGLREARNNRALLAASRNVPMPPHRWQDDVLSIVHPQWLVFAGNVLGWLGLFGIASVVLARRGRPAVAIVGGVAFVIGSALFALGWTSDPRNADSTLAMITSADGADLLNAPANNSTPIAELPAGSPLGILSPRGAWTYCELASGAKGWVRSDSLTAVVPGVELAR